MSCITEVTNCASTFKNKNKQKKKTAQTSNKAKTKNNNKNNQCRIRVMCLSSLLPSDMELFVTKLLVTETAKMRRYIYLRFLSIEEKIASNKMLGAFAI